MISTSTKASLEEIPQASDIAIIGMAGRLPDAANLDEFWQNLLRGHSSIHTPSTQELQNTGVAQTLLDHPCYVRACAPLQQAEYFDAAFFGISDADAKAMDPQQRLFLETAWRALENAGHAGDTRRLKIGVFGSTTSSSYLTQSALRNVWSAKGIDYLTLMGNDKDFLATRTSYCLGLTGPALTIQTACSSSLAATHIARAALQAHDCDLAIVGGVSISFPQYAGYLYREQGILSPDGQCRVFAENAQGTLKGNGVAVVALRRYQDALADKDRILACIVGSAMNNDGADKAGFTAPSPTGQTEVITDALADARIDPTRIGYIEAHGTGTALGDPIEVQSLARAYGRDHEQHGKSICYLGSVKANIGHLDAAAGVVSLIKAVKILQHQHIPQQISCQPTNPALQLEKRGFIVSPRTIQTNPPVEAAAVSAFGIGGTNVHMILRYVPSVERPPMPASDTPYAFVITGKDQQEIITQANQLRAFIEATPSARLDDMALTLGLGRRRQHRGGVLRATSRAQLLEHLQALTAGAYELAPVPASAGPSWLGDLRFAQRLAMPGQPMQPRRYWPDPDGATPVVALSEAAATTHSSGPLAGEAWRQTVAAIFSGLLDNAALGHDDDLFNQNGLDSMGMVEAATQIRDRLGVMISLEDIEAGRTVNGIVQRLEAKAVHIMPTTSKDGSKQQRSERLLPLRAGGDTKLCLVHPAGGSILGYANLAKHLPDEYDIYGIPYPNLDEPHIWSIRRLAAYYLDEIAELSENPSSLILGGHSFGGNVAFEMALQLQARGQQVRTVLLLDSHSPASYLQNNHLPPDYPRAFLALLPILFPNLELPPTDSFTDLSISRILARIGQGRWSKTFIEELHQFSKIWRQNFHALKHWHPDGVLHAPAVYICAQDSENPLILEYLHINPHGAEGWRHLLSQPLTIASSPGDHYSMMRKPEYLPKLAEMMTNALR